MSSFFKIIDYSMSRNKASSSNHIINQQHGTTTLEFYKILITQTSNYLWRTASRNLFPHTTEKSDDNNEKRNYYQRKMDHVNTFEEWNHAASKLDKLEDSTEWVEDPESNDYDWRLLQTRIDEIQHVRQITSDRKSMIFTLKLSLSRNLGNMGNATLYRKTRIGTKKLISDYTDTVIERLNWIGDVEENDDNDLSLKEKHDYFMILRQSYGRTALLLSGGGTLGFFHIGVLKAMVNAQLLPRIISGASTGSIMASIICTLNEEDRTKMLNSPWSIPLKVFEHPEAPESPLLRLNRYLLEGNLYDPNILKAVVAEQLGDITFQEAYNRSRLILNITVSSSSLFEMPRLLNYITAPDVVIWSAVLASCSVPLIYPSQEIYMKSKTGELIPWTVTVDKYRDGSIDNDLPLKRISELFSVNHFVVVQLNPHVAPFLHKDHSEPSFLRTSINFCLRMIKEEVQHRCSQLKELGISPNGIRRLENVLSQRYIGDITIAPELSFKDVKNILSNPDFESATNFIQRGERTTWQKMSKIKHSLKIELAIDAAIYKLRSKLLGESPQIPIEIPTSGSSLMTLSPSNSSSLLCLTPSTSYRSSGSQSPCLSEFQSTDDEEDLLTSTSTAPCSEDKAKNVPLSTTPLLPPTPLWQIDGFEKQLPMLMRQNNSNTSSSLLTPPINSNLSRPSLLPHDISRRGSNVSIRDISPNTSTKFERRKQITSAQFFISPEFEWHPSVSDQDFKKSVVVVKEKSLVAPSAHNKNNLSIIIPK